MSRRSSPRPATHTLAAAVSAADAFAGYRQAEERIADAPERRWTWLETPPNEFVPKGKGYFVDRTDPNNVVVRIRVHLTGTAGGRYRAPRRRDRKHLRLPGFTVDLQLVDALRQMPSR